MKRITLAVAVAVAALAGSAAPAWAESGQLLMGGRLAYNYSTLFYSSTNYYGESNLYVAGAGGSGFEAGVLGRYAVVEGQMGVHVGANFIYRIPYSSSYYWNNYSTSDMAVGVPVLFEINPFVLSGLNSSIYELIFLQIGVQADYVLSYSESRGGDAIKEDDFLFEREKFGFGLVVGAVGYFNSHVSLDIRYYYSFTPFDKTYAKNWYPYSYNIGLSFYL